MPYPKPPKPRKRLTVEEIREIRILASEGVLQKNIAIRFGVSDACISLIIRRKRRSSV